MTMATNSIGIERLRTLYSILAGIPGDRINLDRFLQHKTGYVPETSEEALHDCGTIACAGGWAAIYPEFVEAGLRLDSGHLRFGYRWGFFALAGFFEMGIDDAKKVFGLGFPGNPHKRLALSRIRSYLLRRGAITKERSRELQRLEMLA